MKREKTAKPNNELIAEIAQLILPQSIEVIPGQDPSTLIKQICVEVLGVG